MKERPILFSAPMVRALLAGTKTQTRRVVKLPHENPLGRWEVIPLGGPNGGRTRDGETIPFQNAISHSRTGEVHCCPYGAPGDRLWVRETWCASSAHDDLSPRDIPVGDAIAYFADGEPPVLTGRWRPSIHMPRAASRITLEITDVRVERLQDISEEDARAEGISRAECPDWHAVADYRALWEQINGAGSWDANPWVWVVEFRRLP